MAKLNTVMMNTERKKIKSKPITYKEFLFLYYNKIKSQHGTTTKNIEESNFENRKQKANGRLAKRRAKNISKGSQRKRASL